jgi:CRISPR-associated protein Cas1
VALIADHRRSLYLTTVGTFVALDHDGFEVRRPDQPTVRAPVRSIDSIVCFGNVTLSTAAMARCAEDGIEVSWLTSGGRFRFGLRTPINGNVLLRMEQWRAAVDSDQCLDIAKAIVAAKLLNSRVVLLDAAKDRSSHSKALRAAADELARFAEQSRRASVLDAVRGTEGIGAKRYFAEWSSLISPEGVTFTGRIRRPAVDPVNSLLSFGYALLRTRCTAAAEQVGLDPQVGFLHPVRPGRPSLALDLMEELRAPFVDRLVLTLINRQQITAKSFNVEPTGAHRLTDDGRATFLAAFDSHMRTSVSHRAIEQEIERRKVPGLQALLIARHLRGDLTHYFPYRTTGR